MPALRVIMPVLLALPIFGTSLAHHAASDGTAIIRRHDVPDSLYLQLGARYHSLVHVNLPVPGHASDCEATLIAPQWVVTAAHVAVEVRPGHRVTVGGREVVVDSVYIHPDWDGGSDDIAMLHLAEPVTDVPLARLYRGDDELHAVAVLVGSGDFGTGRSGPVGNDHQVRGATNRIDEVSEHWIKMRFDRPGDPEVTPLEGVSGPGDSGGPAYLDEASGEIVVGISSGQSTRASGGHEGRYGVTEYYTRVSRYIAWVEGITGPLPR